MRLIVPLLTLVFFTAGCNVQPRGPVAPEEPERRLVDRADAIRIVDRFVSVVDRVGPVAEEACLRSRAQFRCDFVIAVDDRLDAPSNAFQTEDRAGRPVIAFTLSLMADVQNEDELAFVMAHEAAHHILGHIARQRQNATVGAVIFGELAGVFGTRSEDGIRAAQERGAMVGARAYSKSYELEADALGARIAVAAGFDPVKGAAFFMRIPDPGDRFLGTHPSNRERINVVREAIKRF